MTNLLIEQAGFLGHALALPGPNLKSSPDGGNIYKLCVIRNKLFENAEVNAYQIRLLEKDALKVNLNLKDCDKLMLGLENFKGLDPWNEISRLLDADDLADSTESPDLNFENVSMSSLSESECNDCRENSARRLEATQKGKGGSNRHHCRWHRHISICRSRPCWSYYFMCEEVYLKLLKDRQETLDWKLL